MSIQLEEKIYFISDNIDEITKEERNEVAKIIYKYPARSNLVDKGGGCQIKFSQMSSGLIDEIYKYILKKINEPSLFSD